MTSLIRYTYSRAIEIFSAYGGRVCLVQIFDGWLWSIAVSGLNQLAEANPSILIFIAVIIHCR